MFPRFALMRVVVGGGRHRLIVPWGFFRIFQSLLLWSKTLLALLLGCHQMWSTCYCLLLPDICQDLKSTESNTRQNQSWDSRFASSVHLSAWVVGTVTWHPFIPAYSLQGRSGLEIIPANTGWETGFPLTVHQVIHGLTYGDKPPYSVTFTTRSQTDSSSLWKNSPISNPSVAFTNFSHSIITAQSQWVSIS